MRSSRARTVISYLTNHEASGYYDAVIGDAEREWVAEAQRKVAGRN
jgi:hypothetical protein